MNLKYLTAITAFAMSNVLSGPSMRAEVDFRDAAKKALPATVAVEWKVSRPATEDARPYPGSSLPVEVRNGRAPSVATASAPKVSRPQARPPAMGFVSGTVVSADGLVVTCTGDEAPDRLDELTVTLENGRQLPGRVVVNDLRSGLQLLKIKAADLPYLRAATEQAEVGQPVLAAMAAGGRARTVARGIIASTSRSSPSLPAAVLQSDVQVGAMAAGGPLVNSEGRLLGIIVAKEARHIDQAGPVFVVPSEFVQQAIGAVAGELKTIRPGFLGVQLSGADSPPEVDAVSPDSPAAKGGIVPGDLIIQLDGREVSTTADLIAGIGRRQSGEKIKFVVRRGADVQKIQVTLGELPQIRRPITRTPGSGRDTESIVGAPAPARIVRDYNTALRRSSEYLRREPAPSAGAIPPQSLTLRVERGDLEEKLDKLREEVSGLREQIKTLARELEKQRSGGE